MPAANQFTTKNDRPLKNEDELHSNVWDVSRPSHLDFLRTFFALMVMLGHSWQYLYSLPGDHPNEPMMRLTHGQVASGYVAVNAFFAISGFLLTRSLLRSSSLRDFLLRRARRIYPAFVVTAFMLWFVLGFFMDSSTALSIAG